MALLVQIEWNPEIPQFFQVYFDDASADQRVGGRDAAESMAEGLGFELDQDQVGESVWWKRPGSKESTSILNDYRPGPAER